MNDDVKRLRLGAIGRHISAAITSLFACIPLIHVLIGLIYLLKPAPAQGDRPNRPAPSQEWIHKNHYHR